MEVYLMKPNFESVTKTELRAYLVSNPGDQEAFYTFVDQFASTPTEVFSGGAEEIEMQVRKKVEELKAKGLLKSS
jgi:hypothetical protein